MPSTGGRPAADQLVSAEHLASEVRRALHEAADPTRASGMQAYMKSGMPYLGVRVPDARKITRSVVTGSPIDDLDELETAARTLWDDAIYRESATRPPR